MSDLVRSNIRAMTGYVPGEQPRDGTYIKLNTNENPYPPSPRFFEAIGGVLASQPFWRKYADIPLNRLNDERVDLSAGDRLRKYPDPLGTEFRQTAGRVLGVDPDAILIGNGSDDVLT